MKPELKDYFSNCLYFTTARLERTLYRMAEESFAPTGLSPSHALILLALREADTEGLSPSGLAALFLMDPSTITRLAAHLQKRKLTRRQKTGRTVRLTITLEGAKLIPPIHKAWHQLYLRYNALWGKLPAGKVNGAIAKLFARSTTKPLYSSNKEGNLPADARTAFSRRKKQQR